MDLHHRQMIDHSVFAEEIRQRHRKRPSVISIIDRRFFFVRCHFRVLFPLPFLFLPNRALCGQACLGYQPDFQPSGLHHSPPTASQLFPFFAPIPPFQPLSPGPPPCLVPSTPLVPRTQNTSVSTKDRALADPQVPAEAAPHFGSMLNEEWEGIELCGSTGLGLVVEVFTMLPSELMLVI